MAEEGGGDVDESAIALIAPQSVWTIEVIGDVKVWPAIAVIIPPGGGEASAVVPEACGGGDFCEAWDASGRGRTVIAVQAVGLSAFDQKRPTVWHGDEIPFFAHGARQGGLTGSRVLDDISLEFFDAGGVLGGNGLSAGRPVGHEVAIKIAVTIEISPAHDDTGSGMVETSLRGYVLKTTLSIIEKQTIGTVIPADHEVEVPIVVDVGHTCAGAPAGGIGCEAGTDRGVRESPLAAVDEEPASAKGAR